MLELARVTAVHPEGPSVDVTMLRNAAPLTGVRLMSPSASGNTGLMDLPDCSVDGSKDKAASQPIGEREMLAVIGFFADLPVCLGFLYPHVSQMLFADRNRRVVRHASDVYETVDGAGNYEFSHPSGTFLRVAESPEHEDLTGRDFDKRWKITKNTTRAPHVRLQVANAGSVVAVLNIDPAGNVSLKNKGDLTAEVGGSLSAEIAGAALVKSYGAMTLDAPTITLNAPTITMNGRMVQGKGSNGGGCTMQGPLNVSEDVTAGGISLMNHDHVRGVGKPT